MPQSSKTPALLVSVRNVEEAAAALAGGADVIDVKEPSLGSLGMAKPSDISAVIKHVNGIRPVSAALGELRGWRIPAGRCSTGLSWVKLGLAGVVSNFDWTTRLADLQREFQRFLNARLVAVAYADARLADAPPVNDVVEFAIREKFETVLIDTFVKDGRSLLDWVTIRQLSELKERLQENGLSLALAGSLQAEHIRRLLPIAPDWIAVRSSACRGGRSGRIDVDLVSELAALVRGESLCVVQ